MFFYVINDQKYDKPMIKTAANSFSIDRLISVSALTRTHTHTHTQGSCPRVPTAETKSDALQYS